MSDADRPSCRHGDSFSPECSPCRGYRMEAAAARISTLEARIAELERERDEAREQRRVALVNYNSADRRLVAEQLRGEHDRHAARSDRDEAVRRLREALNGFDKQTSLNCWREYETGEYVITARSAHEFVAETRKLLLALHPAQPEDCRGECERGKCATCWPETPDKETT